MFGHIIQGVISALDFLAAFWIAVMIIKQRRWMWQKPNQFLFGVLLVVGNVTVGVIVVLIGLGVLPQ